MGSLEPADDFACDYRQKMTRGDHLLWPRLVWELRGEQNTPDPGSPDNLCFVVTAVALVMDDTYLQGFLKRVGSLSSGLERTEKKSAPPFLETPLLLGLPIGI